jgi:uncharacterized protein
MAIDKPSDPEEEYFAKEDLEKVKEIRAKLDAERAQAAKDHLRETHWMRCPKCGHELRETNVRDVAVDVCTHCRGVFLDKGELELLVGMREPILKRLFSAFKEDLAFGGDYNDKPGGLEKE